MGGLRDKDTVVRWSAAKGFVFILVMQFEYLEMLYLQC